MTSRNWTFAILAWLSGCLSLGCTQTLGQLSFAPESPLPALPGQEPATVVDKPSVALAPADPQPAEKPPVIDQPKPPVDDRNAVVSLSSPRPVDVPSTLAEHTVALDVALAAKPVPDAPSVEAFRLFFDKRPGEAVTRLSVYDKANQDMLLCLLPLAARLSEESLVHASSREVDAMLEQMDSSMVPLRALAPLAIEKMCFCRRIDTFGVFEPLGPDYRFRPNEVVQIYVEIRNFATREKPAQSGQPTHVIELTSSGEIRDGAGKRVLPYPLVFERKRPDESRTARHDYFESYRFCMPNLPAGKYSLWIQVDDLGTRPARKAQRSLDFLVTNLPGHD